MLRRSKSLWHNSWQRRCLTLTGDALTSHVPPPAWQPCCCSCSCFTPGPAAAPAAAAFLLRLEQLLPCCFCRAGVVTCVLMSLASQVLCRRATPRQHAANNESPCSIIVHFQSSQCYTQANPSHVSVASTAICSTSRCNSHHPLPINAEHQAVHHSMPMFGLKVTCSR